MTHARKRFVFATATALALLWLAPLGDAAEKVLAGHSDYVYGLAFSPDGKSLASTSGDGTLRLWDVGTGKAHRTIKAHAGSVYAVAFRPDGKVLATAGGDNLLRTWDVATGKEARVLRGHTKPVYCVAYAG